MFSNFVVSCWSLLNLTTFVPSWVVSRIVHAVLATSAFEIFLNCSGETPLTIGFAIIISYNNLFIKSLSYWSSWFSPPIFNRQPNFFIQRFKKISHSYFLVCMIVTIKHRRHNQKMSMIHNNLGSRILSWQVV